MGLNIKNERVHELARAAARVTGKSQTGAIEEALQRLLETYGEDPGAARAARKIDIVEGLVLEYASDPGVEAPAVTSVDDLYDEVDGLPR